MQFPIFILHSKHPYSLTHRAQCACKTTSWSENWFLKNLFKGFQWHTQNVSLHNVCTYLDLFVLATPLSLNLEFGCFQGLSSNRSSDILTDSLNNNNLKLQLIILHIIYEKLKGYLNCFKNKML